MESARRPGHTTCADCQHFHVTYDPRFPYGCRLLGFKSRRPPAQEVVAATGRECQGYQPRPGRARSP